MTEQGLSRMMDTLGNAGRKLLDHSTLLRKTVLTIGTVYVLKHTLTFLSFTHLHLFHRSTLRRYITRSPTSQEQPWALVTGSSDGIGLAFAEELLTRNVNIILHGRNPSKLNHIRNTLLAKYPSRQIRVLAIDACSDPSSPSASAAITQQTSDITLRILINNVGGNGSATPLWSPFSSRSSSDIAQFLDINARFPTDLTRILLPQLQSNSPSLIINIGSGASDFSCPYVSLLSATKSYLQSWSRSLRLEMEAEGHDVEVLHYQVGMVQTNASAERATSLLVPSARDLARKGLTVVGCGREIVWPWWPHALEFGLIGALPTWVRNRVILGIAKDEMAAEEQKMGTGMVTDEKRR